jgi:hypothetical protein
MFGGESRSLARARNASMVLFAHPRKGLPLGVMKKLSVAVFALLFAFCAPSFLPAQTNEKAEQEVLSARREVNRALLYADVDTLNKDLGDELTVVTAGGKIAHKNDILEWIKTGALKYESFEEKGIAIRIYGDTALVTGASTMTGQSFGKPAHSHVFDSYLVVRRGGRWVTVLHQMTALPETAPAAK